MTAATSYRPSLRVRRSTLQGSDQVSIVQFAANLDEYRSWLGVYIFVATVLGVRSAGMVQVLSRGGSKSSANTSGSTASRVTSGVDSLGLCADQIVMREASGTPDFSRTTFSSRWTNRLLVLGWQRRFYVYLDPEEATTHQTHLGRPTALIHSALD